MPAPLVASLLALSSLLHPPAAQELSRGALLPGEGIRYWAVEDTVLDSKDPEETPGGLPFLTCGSGKTLLIRFGDLRRAIGPNRRIRRASILFTVTGGQPAPLSRAAELLVPWGEGPAQVLGYGAAANPTVRNWGANWRARRAGESALPWQQSGALGAADARSLSEPKSQSPDPDHVRIVGLEAALQRQYDRPQANFGFAFAFEGSVEFSSSQGRTGRPVLELELEDAAAPQGPDLAVVRIERLPEYPRFAPPATIHRAAQDGVEVALAGPPANQEAKTAPSPGEEMTYTAVIKNVGHQAIRGFSLRWTVRERPGGSAEYERVLAPGAETTVTMKAAYRISPTDHRVNPLAVSVEPLEGPDVDPSNNGLTVFEGALSVGFRIAPAVAEAIASKRPLGARSAEEWAQAVVSLWNETIFPQSQFSFAPNGALERLRLQRVEIAKPETPDFGTFESPNLDLAIAIGESAKLDDPVAMRRLLKAMGREMGLADLAPMNLDPANGTPPLSLGNQSIGRFAPDLFAGLMGGGDTRYDGFVPNLLIPPYEPIVSPIFDVLYLPSTDLLAASDVAALNAAIGLRRGVRLNDAFAMPGSVVLKITDMAGLPMGNADVEVYPMAGGSFKADAPIARLQTGENGTVALPNRPTLLPTDFKWFPGKPLGANPFGRLDPAGNGVLALRISAGGNVGFQFVKAWQLADAYRRNTSPVVVFDVRVNSGGRVETAQNLAKNRIVTDSDNGLPAALAPLVDEALAEPVTLVGAAKDAWVEVDLGRDRAFGEVRLFAKGPFWERFSIVAYSTGQTVAEAKVLAREAAWSYAFANRSEAESVAGVRSVAYRTSGMRARYIRLIRTDAGPPGALTEIKVFALKSPEGPPPSP